MATTRIRDSKRRILLILLAAPLLGALAMMASGNNMMAQMPTTMDGRMMGLATIWIALILLLIVVAIVLIARSIRQKGPSERDKAA